MHSCFASSLHFILDERERDSKPRAVHMGTFVHYLQGQDRGAEELRAFSCQIDQSVTTFVFLKGKVVENRSGPRSTPKSRASFCYNKGDALLSTVGLVS